MECPHCEKTIKVPSHSVENAKTYAKSNIVKTKCCGKLIKVIPVTVIKVEIYEGNRIEDDWGEKI